MYDYATKIVYAKCLGTKSCNPKPASLSLDMDSLTNQLLIAMPNLKDPFFSQAVVYICEHGKDGAFGIIINKKYHDLKLNTSFKGLVQINDEFRRYENTIYFGGPVLVGKGLIFHKENVKTKESIKISESAYITSNLNILKQLDDGIDSRFKLVLGHAGWSRGQLENELKNGDWLVQNATDDFLFNTPPKKLWSYATSSLGFDTNNLVGVSGRA